MNVNQRLLILFIAIVLAFAGFFYLFYSIRHSEAKAYQDLDLSQRKATIDAFFDLKMHQQLKIVEDYTIWDDMCEFVQEPHQSWGTDNLSSLIPTFGYSSVEVLTRNGNRVFYAEDPQLPNIKSFTLQPSIIDSLRSKRLMYYVHKDNNLLIATAAASIHPTYDTLRITEPRGYVFISQAWTASYLGDLAKSMGYTLSISNTVTDVRETKTAQHNIRVIREIRDIAGNPIAWMNFSSTNIQMKELKVLGIKILIGIAGFLLIFLVTQYALMQYWISQPLKLISQSLKEGKPDKIQSLHKDKNEFSVIAALIESFFAQKTELLNEIEERAKTEAKLREAEEQTRKVFITSPESIIVADLDGNILSVNDESIKLFGAYAGEFDPDNHPNIKDIATSESIETLNSYRAHLPLHKVVKGEEVKLKTYDGREFPALISSSVMYDSNRTPSKMILITRDISDLKSLEMRLRQSQKMESIGTLAGGIAHDFNNIITIIAGYIALGAGKIDGQQAVQKDLDEALKACLRAKSLVGKILTFSRMQDKEVKTLCLKETVEEALPILRASIPSSIKIESTLFSEANIAADPTEIQQILLNLASNAYHAMRPYGGTLMIKLEEISGFELIGLNNDVELASDYLHLHVSDTGSGMPPELIDRIFDPYFSTKPPGEGNGLGLSIVHGIVSSYRGFITVNSRLGIGTMFNLYIPVVEEKIVKPIPVVESEPDFVFARIIFVDDELMLAELFGEALGAVGYEVKVFNHSQEALDHFLQDPSAYDLLIADVTMPGMDGLRLAAHFKAQRDIPVILYSGFTDNRIVSETKSIGVTKLLSKPILPDDMILEVKRVLAGIGKSL